MRNLFVISCFVLFGFFVFSFSTEAKVYLPDGVGNYSQWFQTDATCSSVIAGVFGEVDEYPVHNSDTDYNCVNAANQLQFYNLKDNTDSGTITNVRVVVVAQGVTAGESLQLGIRLGINDDFATAQIITTSYAAYTANWATKPFAMGGGSWTTSDITFLQAGFKSIQNGATWDSVQRVTQLYIDVTFKTETNRAKFHIVQETGNLASGVQIDRPFSFTITDPIDEVRNAFIEIKGIADPNASPTTLRVAVNDTLPGTCDVGRVKCYTLNSTGRPASFRILYDVTDYFKDPTGGNVRTSGGYNFTLNLRNDGLAAINISSGKLVINYSWIVPPVAAGAYMASGTLTSVTFDTGATDGATYNSIHWLGTINSGKVKFQLATSNISTGPFDFIGGATCSSGDSYEPASPFSNTPVEITCAPANHNNHRYFRYKVQICSSDCSEQGSTTPIVDNVIVNWSP